MRAVSHEPVSTTASTVGIGDQQAAGVAVDAGHELQDRLGGTPPAHSASASAAGHVATASGAGLRITAFPAASAASTPPAGIDKGKFHGDATTTVPHGREPIVDGRNVARRNRRRSRSPPRPRGRLRGPSCRRRAPSPPATRLAGGRGRRPPPASTSRRSAGFRAAHSGPAARAAARAGPHIVLAGGTPVVGRARPGPARVDAGLRGRSLDRPAGDHGPVLGQAGGAQGGQLPAIHFRLAATVKSVSGSLANPSPTDAGRPRLVPRSCDAAGGTARRLALVAPNAGTGPPPSSTSANRRVSENWWARKLSGPLFSSSRRTR